MEGEAVAVGLAGEEVGLVFVDEALAEGIDGADEVTRGVVFVASVRQVAAWLGRVGQVRRNQPAVLVVLEQSLAPVRVGNASELATLVIGVSQVGAFAAAFAHEARASHLPPPGAQRGSPVATATCFDDFELAADAVMRGDGVTPFPVRLEGEAADGFVHFAADRQAMVGKIERVELDLAAFRIEIHHLAALGPHGLVERVRPAMSERAGAVRPCRRVVPLETNGQRSRQLEVDRIRQHTARRYIHRMAREEAHPLTQEVAQTVAPDAAEQGMQVSSDPLRAHHRAERVLQ
jgi:hypothetical protein